MASAEPEISPSTTASSEAAASPKVNWKTDHLKSTYANFANVTSTREEVVLNFGVNHDWERTPQAVEIELQHRVILSPFAAKRLQQLLGRLVSEYETRHGELK